MGFVCLQVFFKETHFKEVINMKTAFFGMVMFVISLVKIERAKVKIERPIVQRSYNSYRI